ncbi:4'-phosphopantetheinyl transferase family protein [Streptomyces sp. NPDC057939]|uniref:4'-phosphopantetheinyl transferase family protein n=1 Tax=Streptomyces sp. NPDC057939 TaxID=3346284 RepID=UPI0036ED3E30
MRCRSVIPATRSALLRTISGTGDSPPVRGRPGPGVVRGSCRAACAAPIGVDIEAADRVRMETLNRRLHPAEHTAIKALPADRRHEALLRCWTRKEAYLKGLGTGLATPPNQVNVGTGLTRHDDDELAARNGWTLTAITAPAGYAASVAILLPPGTRARTTMRTRAARPYGPRTPFAAAHIPNACQRTTTSVRRPEPLRAV